MNSVGIICEYNPFHNGHLYHLKKVKELFPGNTIILILSPTFTQRGIPSIINKWDKTSLALDYGIDLVVELPYPFACQSADFFAKGAIQLLTSLNVSHLVFGSECNNIEVLTKIAKVQVENKKCDDLVKHYLQEGINYPTAISKAIKKLIGETVLSPNDLLGISYIKEIIKQESNIIPVCIKRTNNYHGNDSENNIMSATGIRDKIKNKEEVSKYIPNYDINLLKYDNSYFEYLKYKIISEGTEIKKYQTVDEGIENRILKYILEVNSIEELIEKVKTKRYTYNKINRMLNHILCSFTKEEAHKFKDISYIRILGFNNQGKQYLSTIKKEVTLPIITNCKNNNNEMLLLEHRITNIYNTIQDIKDNEIIRKPIIKR